MSHTPYKREPESHLIENQSSWVKHEQAMAASKKAVTITLTDDLLARLSTEQKQQLLEGLTVDYLDAITMVDLAGELTGRDAGKAQPEAKFAYDIAVASVARIEKSMQEDVIL